ncbi:hypothetical protein ACC720_37720, partial [Rhizobium ruizarguesonis]
IAMRLSPTSRIYCPFFFSKSRIRFIWSAGQSNFVVANVEKRGTLGYPTKPAATNACLAIAF